MPKLTARSILQHAVDTGNNELAALTIATGGLAYLRILQEENATVSLTELLGKLCKVVTANAPAPELASATTRG